VLPRLPIALALLLSACAQDPRDVLLAEVDLSNAAVMQELARGLSPKDKAALVVYTLVHAPSSTGFCGQKLVGRDGVEPMTIGDAITLTLRREAELRTARVEAARPKTAPELAREQWDGLIIQREMLLARQSALLSDHGPAARRMPEWDSVEAEMTESDQKLAVLKPKIEDAGSS
jgi:hypothetical protein